MTFDDLKKALPEEYRAALDEAVELEAQALFDVGANLRPIPRQVRARKEAAREAAQKFIAGDVTAFLAGEKTFSARDVLIHRPRHTYAWALAEILREQARMSLRHSVDVPNADKELPWIHVKDFATRKEALDFARRSYGADDQGRVQLVTGISE